MKWTPAGHRGDATPIALEFTARAAAERPGTLLCSAHGCRAVTGLSCSFTDRRGHACLTAWCPLHRAVVGDSAYCPSHARLLGDEADPLSESERPDLENPVPLLVAWAARAVEDDIVGLMRPLCDAFGLSFVADPLHLVHAGIDRVRTWERGWKLTSHLGIALRVQVAVEEARPGTVLAKVNTKVVFSGLPPAAQVRDLADAPGVARISQVETFRYAIFEAVEHAVISWRRRQHAAATISLSGTPHSLSKARAARQRPR